MYTAEVLIFDCDDDKQVILVDFSSTKVPTFARFSDLYTCQYFGVKSTMCGHVLLKKAYIYV